MLVVGALMWRTGQEPPVVPRRAPTSSVEPLIALPWDEQVERRVGDLTVLVPTRWAAGGGPSLVPLALSGGAEAALTSRLSADCARPVVLRWREQWRGECLTATGTRIRGAVIREDGVWQGVEARYPDGQDARVAPRVARMLASLKRVR